MIRNVKRMMITLIIYLSVLMTFSQKQDTENDYSILKGNWHYVYSKDYDDPLFKYDDPIYNYYELHIRDSTLQFCFLLNEGGIHSKYYIENDSLYLIPEPNESTSFNWISKIDIINDSIVKLKFPDSTKDIIIFRMHENIYDPVDHFLAGKSKETFNTIEYDANFYERAMTYIEILVKRTHAK